MSDPNPTISTEEVEEREHLPPEVMAKIAEANTIALAVKAELQKKIEAGEPTSAIITEGRKKIKGLGVLMSMKSRLDVFNLDVPAEERFNVLSLMENRREERIKEWVSSPDHKCLENVGPTHYNNFHNFFSKHKDPMSLEFSLGKQIMADFKKKYPDTFEILENEDARKADIKIISGGEIMQKVQELFSQGKGQEAGILMEDAHKNYYEQHPDSSYAKWVDALNKAYAIMRNEYGLIDTLLRS